MVLPLNVTVQTALLETIASLKGSNGCVILVSEVHELPRFMTFWTMLCVKWVGMYSSYFSRSLFLLQTVS